MSPLSVGGRLPNSLDAEADVFVSGNMSDL